MGREASTHRVPEVVTPANGVVLYQAYADGVGISYLQLTSDIPYDAAGIGNDVHQLAFVQFGCDSLKGQVHTVTGVARAPAKRRKSRPGCVRSAARRRITGSAVAGFQRIPLASNRAATTCLHAPSTAPLPIG